MPITQQHFFNSSIRNFSCSIGWGNQSSSLSINLAEDPTLNEVFSPVQPGLPAYFSYDNFRFGGLVQNYKRKNSPQGYPVWEVTLVDPRDVLEGVQIIIDGYTGTIGNMPNLFNVYGYLENIAYGNAEVNDGGILTSKLRAGLDALLAIGILGSPINYLGAAYYVDLSSLPVLPDFHRIGGGFSLSLMDIISKICEDSARDFFITLYRGPANENVIKVHTVSRLNQPDFGKINDFINAHTGAVQNEVGLESRNEVVGKFLVGGQVAAMWFQFDNEGEAGNEDDTILQFWGVDANGVPVIERAFEDNNPRFTLDSRNVQVHGIGATYESDVEEMRAALGGQVSWEIFLNAKDLVAGPHLGKASALGMPAQKALVDILAAVPPETGQNEVLDYFKKNISLAALAPFTGRLINRFDRGDEHQENITALFQYISDFANQYYGRKFMVRITDIQAKIESETNRIVTNYQPTDGGFIDEADFPGAIGNKLMPTDFDRVSLEDGRLQCYVRFDNADELDLHEIPNDDMIIDGNSVFIKCNVEPNIYVLNSLTLESPRVVVELPGRVYGETRTDFAGALKIILGPSIRAAGIDEGAPFNNVFKELLTRMGADDLMVGTAGIAIKPDMAAIPLLSNTQTYGPWHIHGANGKIEFEQNNELVPWLYGGFAILNQVGNALVSEALAGQIRAETGSITVPDGPNLNIGSELIAGGPYITSVNVEVGENGVTTTYRMETWTPRFGKMAKLNSERMAKLAKENVIRKRELRKLARLQPPNAAFFKARQQSIKELGAPKRSSGSTSSTYIGGQINKKTGEDIYHNDVAIMPEYNSLSALSNDYANKAFMSLDGLFRPFSTKKTDEGVPHYETPDEGTEKNVDDLDPFQSGNDIAIVARDTTLQQDTHMKDMSSPNQRPVALRGPLVVAGWGYDTNGKPVPNYNPDDPTDEFLTGHLERSDKWKVGPVDLQWDNNRKVWAAGNGANTRVIKMLGDLPFGATNSGVLMDLYWDGTVGSSISLTESTEIVTVGEVTGYEYYDTIAVTDTKLVLAIQSNENQELYIFLHGFLE
jgi:hypothetical protein